MKKSLLALTLAAMLLAGNTVLAAPTADQVAAEAAADPGASAAYRTPAKGSAAATPATKAAKARPPKPQSSDLQTRYVESRDIFQTASLRNTYVSPDYRLFRGDTMSLLVVGFPDGIGIDKITVGLDGYVQLPYVGSVKMEGLTLDEAKQVVLNSLNQYLRVPDLTLMITKYGPRKVYVMGEVKNPGIQDMSIDNMNAYAALASAGGWARKGRSTRIQILRVIDGVMYYRTLNMKAYTIRHDLTQNVALENGDILYVPKTNGIKFDTDVMPYINAWIMYKALVDD